MKFIKTIQKFIKISFWNWVNNHKQYCSTLCSRPIRQCGPWPPPLRPPGPVVQQPMAGPPNRPTHCVRLGQNPAHDSLDARSRPSPQMMIRRLTARLAWTKPRPPAAPGNPSSILFCPPPHISRMQGGGGGAPVPACQPATARSSAARRAATACLPFLAFFPLPHFPSLAHARSRDGMAVHGGPEEGRWRRCRESPRRWAHSPRGRVRSCRAVSPRCAEPLSLAPSNGGGQASCWLPVIPRECQKDADGGDSGGGGRSHGRSFPPRSFASLLFRSRVRVSVLHCKINSRSIPLFISFPKHDPLPSTALVPLIEPSNHLGVDRVDEHCVNHTSDLYAPQVLLMELCT
jgi:hypothetical protein